MLKHIKRYELTDGLTAEDLESKGFKKFERLSSENKITYYNKNSCLYNDIEVFVDIIINDDGSLSFDDCENVLVMDDRFGQPYTPFYDNKLFHFLSYIIFRYNEFMDSLVEDGILKQKTLEEEMTRKLEK